MPDAQGETPDPTATDPEAEPADDYDKDRALATIRKLRESEKAGRQAAKERDDLAAKLKERENADLSEAEKLRKDLDEATKRAGELEQQVRAGAVKDAVTSAAADAGATRPHAVWRLVEQGAVQVGEDGKVTGVKDAVDQVKKEFPELFRAPNGTANGGTSGGGADTTDMSALIRRSAGRG